MHVTLQASLRPFVRRERIPRLEFLPAAAPAAEARGVAAALTASLGGAAFARGIPALMLMAYEADQGVYARAGFIAASEIAFMSLTP
ncbi:MAG: hypothetical protein QOJ85_3811 [Solirubrobacteraceae bacterium]|nr:hypothetical protein [Solirubrobacteraceae bacterium]